MNPLNAEKDVARLVARAKLDKEAAKDYRDEGNIRAAVEVLKETVDTLAASPLANGLENATAPSKPMCELAAQLADCLGMLGGNHRREGNLLEAQKAFERGRLYEESPALGVPSSYNLVNSITLPIESSGQIPEAMLPAIARVVSALSRQVLGDRRSDRWAWADLAQCQLLLGDQAGALQSYGRVRGFGDTGTVKSVTDVLERLGNAAPVLKDRVAAAITYLKSDSP